MTSTIDAPAVGKVGRMAMVSLFKQQLESESQAIASARGLVKRGDNLIWWYFLRRVGLEAAAVESIVCDGFNDLAIDAIWIDDNDTVHFYNFKNPRDMTDIFGSEDVDKMISGLHLILARGHEPYANAALRARIEEIESIVPSGYKIHLVTSGTGLAIDARAKMTTFISSLGAPTPDFATWELEDISGLQTAFYEKSLPTVDKPHEIALSQMPYLLRSADHDCYMFHMTGEAVASLYGDLGELLLQQNIRVYQGDKSTNALIRETATGVQAGNFFHYNNGIVFLAEYAQWDPFNHRLGLRRFQVVNGGQTIRVLHRAWSDGELRSDVVVPIRVITSQGDKDFSNNVTVNLNHQNKIETSFLRSNDPRVVQLGHALASLGWYLERRENEVDTLGEADRLSIEARIGAKLNGRTIRLREGMQAYVATFLGLPELAKKNPKRIFLGATDGGSFDRVFAADLKAENVILSYQLYSLVGEYVRQFMTRKRRKDRVEDWVQEYSAVLGSELVEKHGTVLDQVLPQSTIFLSAIVFEEWVHILGWSAADLIKVLTLGDYTVLNTNIGVIIDEGQRADSKSWPTLLKSQPFFEQVTNFLRGKRSARA